MKKTKEDVLNEMKNKKLMNDLAKANEATSGEDRMLGIKFEATKILLPFLSDKVNGAVALGKEVNAFLQEIGYE